MQGGGLTDAVEEDSGVSVAVIIPSECSEPLNTCCVPDGEHDVLILHFEESSAGVDAGGGGLSLVKCVISEAPKYGTLADTQLPQEHHLVVRTSVSHLANQNAELEPDYEWNLFLEIN